jgi:nicotinamidase-related amidase
MSKALLLVDIQNDYFKNGAMELVGMDEAAANAQKILVYFRANKWPVYHVRHAGIGPKATFFLPDTQGAQINEAVLPLESEPVITKYLPNSFRETGLQDLCEKEGIKQLVICGAMSHMCIDATTRAAFDLGFGCKVVADACATRNLEFDGRVVVAADVHAAFMAALNGIYAQVLKTKAFIENK